MFYCMLIVQLKCIFLQFCPVLFRAVLAVAQLTFLIYGKYRFGFVSCCCPVVDVWGVVWHWITQTLHTVSAPQDDTCAQTHLVSCSPDGVGFPSMPLLLRTLENQRLGGGGGA